MVKRTAGWIGFLGGVVLLLVEAGGGPTQARVNMAELRVERRRTYQRRHFLRKKLRGVKQEQRQISQELRIAQTGLKEAEQDLARIGKKLARTEKSLAAAQAELEKTEQQLQIHTGDLWNRLNVFYQRGTLGYLEVVVGAADFADFVSRTELIRTIVEQDMGLLRKIQAERQKRAALESSLQAQQAQLLHLRQQQIENRRRIRVQTARKSRLLSSLDRDRRTYERSLAEIESSRRQIEGLIRRLTRSATSRSGSSQSPVLGSLSRRLQWPVAGRVTDGFGYRRHPIWKTRRFHDGIDLAAPHGTLIRAAAAGRVIHSGWMRAYGKTIIIDHGGGLTTLYGHCSSLLVGCGAQIRRGQAIARVGSTGISTGNHVHFSTYVNGKAVNPRTVR